MPSAGTASPRRSSPGTDAPTRLGVIANLARGIPPQDKGFAPTLLRDRSVAGRDVLAHAATKGAHVAAGLDELGLRAADVSDADVPATDASTVAGFEAELVAAYAQVSALQLGDARGSAVAVGLHRLLRAADRMSGVKRRHRDLAPQLLLARGDLAGAGDLLAAGKLTPSVRTFLRADLLNPVCLGTAPDQTGPERNAWLAALSRALVPSSGVADIGVLPGTPTPFDGLTAAGTLPPVHGPLVTVITSAYNPGQPLLTAARSMIEQTWQDWELLVVDDASPNPDGAVLDTLAALDPRIRVIRKAVNGGTYRCRNTAMRQARGDFITTLDSDDWAHPQRLELGVAPLLAEPGLMATRSMGVRATEDLVLTRPGYAGPFVAASALLFRAREVMGRIGFFDTVRKAADTEYARRIEAAFGQQIRDVATDDILTVLRGGEQTLSADDFAAGWRHEARPAYKQAYTRWHEAINAGRADPFLDPDGERPFPAPRRWTRPVAPSLAAPGRFDIVIAGDWRRYGGPQISMMQEIDACVDAGLRVAVMHIEALRFYTSRDQPLAEPLAELISTGTVERVFPDDDLDVDVLILRYPPILQFPPVVGRTFTPRRLYVMANQAPGEPDGSDPRYVPADVSANAEALFGVVPQWIPQGPTIRTLLEGMLPADAVTSWDNPGLIDVDEGRVRSDRPVGERPVVGRFSRDDRIKFPDDPADLLAAYALPEPYVVRMMGATVTVPALLAKAGARQPANWTLLEHRALDVRDFLADLDFVVYMDNPNANEAFGRALLESATCGAVVIAAPKHAATFGEACVYAEPADVRALLDHFVADPGAYAAQVARTQAWVRSHFSKESFAQRVLAIQTELRADEAAALGLLVDEDAAVDRSDGRWVTVPLRRAGDGEHADALAARHTGGVSGRAAATATLRDLVDRLSPGEPLTDAAALAAIRPGVTAVAQRLSGEVIRVPAADRVAADQGVSGR